MTSILALSCDVHLFKLLDSSSLLASASGVFRIIDAPSTQSILFFFNVLVEFLFLICVAD